MTFRRLERYYIFGLLVYIIVQSIFPHIERRFYWGEWMVILGSFFLFRIPFNQEGHDKNLFFLILIWVIFFPIYGVFISKMYWADVFHPIFLIRHTVFFYYCLFFFVAYKYTPLILQLLKKYAATFLIITPYIIINSSFAAPTLLGLFLVTISLRFPDNKNFYIMGLGIVALSFFIGSGGGTAKLMLFSIFCFVLLNKLASRWSQHVTLSLTRFFISALVISSITLGIYLLSLMAKQITQMAMLGDGITSLGQWVKNLHTDYNGLWRPVLWSHLYGRLLEHPWGLGLGTPLFEQWLDGFVMLHLDKPGENYVQGAHNSFITFFARLGIPSIFLFSLIFFHSTKLVQKVFAGFNYRPLSTREGRLLTGAFFTMLFSTLVSCFNVSLESPLFAGIYWFSFGLFVRLFGDAAQQFRKMNLTPFPNSTYKESL